MGQYHAGNYGKFDTMADTMLMYANHGGGLSSFRCDLLTMENKSSTPQLPVG